MTIKVPAFTINDAELEAGIAQGLAADNAARASMDPPLTGRLLPDFCVDVGADALEAFRGSAKADLIANAQKLDFADLAEFKDTIAAKVAAKETPDAAIAEAAILEAAQPAKP